MTKKTFIIAEAGVNHNGSLTTAKQLVDAAVCAGVDAIKFQTFRATHLVTAKTKMATYQKKNLELDGPQLEMLQSLELSFEDFRTLQHYCSKNKLLFLSTPFDEESARFLLEDLDMEMIKVPSGEIINTPFLGFLSRYNKPMILSTGMSHLKEVQEAVHYLRESNHANQLTVLQCTTNYPCPDEEVNLNAMLTLKEVLKLPVGFSDHTIGLEAPMAAVALGANIIEKHFTLNRNMKGPDHSASLEPNELKRMVTAIRKVEVMLGNGIKKPSRSEEEIKSSIRKSIVSNRKLRAGSIVTREMLSIKRAGSGISPKELEKIVGRKLKRNKVADESFSWSDFQ